MQQCKTRAKWYKAGCQIYILWIQPAKPLLLAHCSKVAPPSLNMTALVSSRGCPEGYPGPQSDIVRSWNASLPVLEKVEVMF